MLARKEYKSELRKMVRDIKRLSGCKKCGVSDPDILEFHHIDPGQKIWKIADMVSKGMKIPDVLKEIVKCEVLCTKHHDEADLILLEKYNYKLPRNKNRQPQRRAGKKK